MYNRVNNDGNKFNFVSRGFLDSMNRNIRASELPSLVNVDALSFMGICYRIN